MNDTKPEGTEHPDVAEHESLIWKVGDIEVLHITGYRGDHDGFEVCRDMGHRLSKIEQFGPSQRAEAIGFAMDRADQ